MKLIIVAAAVGVAMAMVACSSGDGSDEAASSTTQASVTTTTVATSVASAADVNLQGRELPKLVRCPYSGPIDTYLAETEKLKGSSSESIAGTWTRLKESGAIEATIHVYAASPAACQSWIIGSDEGDPSVNESLASSVVVKFKDHLAAQATYAADIFSQSQLNRLEGTISGTETGLGPNSITGGEESEGKATYQAVWRKGSFIVFLRGRNLSRADFTVAAAAQDTRIH